MEERVPSTSLHIRHERLPAQNPLRPDLQAYLRNLIREHTQLVLSCATIEFEVILKSSISPCTSTSFQTYLTHVAKQKDDPLTLAHIQWALRRPKLLPCSLPDTSRTSCHDS